MTIAQAEPLALAKGCRRLSSLLKVRLASPSASTNSSTTCGRNGTSRQQEKITNVKVRTA
jgi:hypothetical protein